ncbi:MAG: pilin [Minisyncoccota bacterium]
MKHSTFARVLFTGIFFLSAVAPVISFAALPPCLAGYIGLTCTPTPSSPPPASGGINTYYLQGYSASIINIINGLVAPVLLAIAFIFFLWGVYKYFIFGATNDTERATGRQFVLWSIIGFVVIFSIWGLVGVVGSTFGLSPGGYAPPYPTL